MKYLKSCCSLLSIFFLCNTIIAAPSINPKEIKPGTVDSTEFGYLDGVRSSIQNQIDGIVVGETHWGAIIGIITNQTDLWTQLTNRFTIAEIIALPVSTFANDAGYITTSTDTTFTNWIDVSGILTLTGGNRSGSNTIMATSKRWP